MTLGVLSTGGEIVAMAQVAPFASCLQEFGNTICGHGDDFYGPAKTRNNWPQASNLPSNEGGEHLFLQIPSQNVLRAPPVLFGN